MPVRRKSQDQMLVSLWSKSVGSPALSDTAARGPPLHCWVTVHVPVPRMQPGLLCYQPCQTHIMHTSCGAGLGMGSHTDCGGLERRVGTALERPPLYRPWSGDLGG